MYRSKCPVVVIGVGYGGQVVFGVVGVVGDTTGGICDAHKPVLVTVR